MIRIARLTLLELVRRRFVASAAVATAAIVAASAWGFLYVTHLRRDGVPIGHLELLGISAILTVLMAYLFSFVLAIAAVFLAAPAFAGDIESGVLLPLLARPVSRACVIGGKALALAAIMCAYAFAAAGSEFVAIKAVTGYLPPDPAAAIGYLCLLSLVMLALSFALSTRLSAIAASIIALCVFALAWIGGIAQSLGIFYANGSIEDAGTITQLLMPTDAMWRAAVYRLEPVAAVASLGQTHVWPGPFFVLAPPPAPLVWWTAGWIVLLFAIAARSFAVRDL